MGSLAAYNTYRKVGQELINKVMKASLSAEALTRSAKLLGISQRGVFVFDGEEEMPVLFDFALHEYRTGGKNAIDLYRETKGPANAVEKELLAGWAAAYTSLFRIVLLSKADHTLRLRDLLTGKDEVELTDVNLSRTAVPGFVLFLRLVPLKGCNITSGFLFVFPGHLEERLLAEYKRSSKKGQSPGDAQRRFVHFFRAYKARGMEVKYG